MSPILRRRTDTAPPVPHVPAVPDGVLQVCHPDWRGVRSSAVAFGDPVLESADLGALADSVGALRDAGVRTVVVQGWPPGAGAFVRSAHGAGLDVRAVSHSAPTQHGVDAGEAEAVAEALGLLADGALARFGTVKAGLAGAFASLGHAVDHVPNRVPSVTRVEPMGTPEGIHAGILLFPMWRKNVTTQVLAARRMGWVPHVMADPGVPYLPRDEMVVHGELARDEFLPVLAAMDIALNVTLSECHPMIPMESYRLGVPCLMSRTSDLFARNAELWNLTTVDAVDDPEAIAVAAARLVDDCDRAVELANTELDLLDLAAERSWRAFTGRE